MTLLRVYPKNGHVSPGVQRPYYLSDLMNEFFPGESKVSRFTNPKANIAENADNYEIVLALPGMTKKDIELLVEKETLTIRHKNNESREEVSYARKEFDFNGFERSFSLPETVNTEKISARMENGMLTVTLPKKDEAVDRGPRNINIS